eukprot:CAMPEP_0113483820 /NCGR_PEP_ID=MMETSP0014_2-20120614/23635_1 /TAXON_ID=2857 /ORGANISM="Nitzschia sp." /LENGTH=113 /DNA_ID=CAMNT_0000377387 /DNA_START=19 /DNA_END=360 /DNA_ORIENTATION=+ /assembly_acc=CAM_ASM_000159
MVNPVTDFFRGLQETEASRIGRMAERVAEGSVDSQKQSDEYNRVNLFNHMYYMQEEPRPHAYNVYSCLNSYFCARDGGHAGSFKTVSFYNNQAKDRRTKLTQKFTEESAVAQN